MATVNLTSDQLNDVLKQNDIVFLDFWASWCMPCQRFGPIYEAASERHPDIVFGKINTEEEQDLAEAASVTSIPTVMIFRDQLPVFSQPGALQAGQLDDLVKQVKELDMEKVKAELENAGQKSE